MIIIGLMIDFCPHITIICEDKFMELYSLCNIEYGIIMCNKYYAEYDKNLNVKMAALSVDLHRIDQL